MPRVLTFQNGKVIQAPLEEMKNLRKNKKATTIQSFGQWKTTDSCFELYIRREDACAEMELRLREDVTLIYRKQVFALKMGKSGHGRRSRTIQLESVRNVRVFSDTSAIEIFINDGEEVMTTRVYSEGLEQTVEFLDSATDGEVYVYDLGQFVIEDTRTV